VYDSASPNDSRINLDIDPASVDTNHAERDKQLRSDDFLDVKKYSDASYSSTSFVGNDNGGTLTGTLDMHGVSKEIVIDVLKIGEGKDPWGNYRVGFAGSTELVRKDFGIGYNLGPAAETMQFEFTIEGILQK
jgi:polyisoprenoid-binding protein YceI